eukprot:TRINITY_DN12692_c0_g1_i1.p1 TRINITY_DN12692_c0_g1~~TRINITY_DN12692_c0_g1_i1.p1  ORF type:complete len:442 (+),score=157.22 TRINITY_DN12692_c0_g1_i1:237-1562(+)
MGGKSSKGKKEKGRKGKKAAVVDDAPPADDKPVADAPALAKEETSNTSPDPSPAPAKEEPKKEEPMENGKSEEASEEESESESESETDSEAGVEWLEDEVDRFQTGMEQKTVGKDDFELITVIGKGSFGKVMQVRHKEDGHIYAMKVLRKEAIIARKQVAHTKAEKSILQKIQHPFIVKLNFAFQTDDKLYMILDYINGGELFYHLKKEGRFSEERVRMYAAEIALALLHLHQFDIVYRDLKPENILLDSEGHIKITDFGLSKELQNEEGTHTFCGTPEYLAPEVLKGQGHGTAVDWWSLGTLIYEMLTGLPPFYSQNINIMYQKILNGELRFPSYVSPEAQHLLTGLLTRDVSKRLQGDAVREEPFFKPLDWDKLEAKEITPPWKPKVKGDADVSQIDPVFTQDQAIDSVVEKSALSDAASTHFDNFTFVNESVMGMGDE